jgi:hypothetical protein
MDTFLFIVIFVQMKLSRKHNGGLWMSIYDCAYYQYTIHEFITYDKKSLKIPNGDKWGYASEWMLFNAKWSISQLQLCDNSISRLRRHAKLSGCSLLMFEKL